MNKNQTDAEEISRWCYFCCSPSGVSNVHNALQPQMITKQKREKIFPKDCTC